MVDLSGKSAVVTGASRGIGAATARELAASGAAVVLAARTVAEIGTIADEITAAGGQAHAIACDVTDYTQFEAATDAARAMTGKLDILINNAGVIDPIGPLADSDPEEWVRAAAINYKSVYYGLRIALPVMKAQGAGTVATYMQQAISASGINPVSQLDWSAHVPPEWPARAMAWLCGPEGRDYAGEEVSLRDESIRRRIGLT